MRLPGMLAWFLPVGPGAEGPADQRAERQTLPGIPLTPPRAARSPARRRHLLVGPHPARAGRMTAAHGNLGGRTAAASRRLPLDLLVDRSYCSGCRRTRNARRRVGPVLVQVLGRLWDPVAVLVAGSALAVAALATTLIAWPVRRTPRAGA
jgi:hypothetical protein